MSDPTWWLDRPWLLAGVVALVVAVGWRQVVRHRTRTRLVRALHDPDPVRRRAAVGVATEQGLRAHSRLLAARIDAETDPAVLAALVDGVLRNAWEPADRESILRLRLWAHEQRARRPEPRPRPATGAALAATTAPIRIPVARHPAPAAARPAETHA